MTAGVVPLTAPRAPRAPRPAAVLAVACTAVVLSSLDLFVVNVALPQMSRSFHGAGLPRLSWVLNGYAIVFAALLVPAGRLADRSGRRRGFLAGAAVFTLASAACAAAGGVGTLVAFRVVQAAGAAVLVPTSLGLVLAAYPPQRRAGAVRTWAAMGGLAAAIGPVLGGLLVAVNWRWIFLVNVPVGILAIAAGRRVLPRVPGEQGAMPDVWATLALAAGISLLVLALVEGNDWSWGSARAAGAFATAALCLAVFAVRSARHPSPVVEPALLRQRGFGFATVATILFSVAFGAMLLSAVLWAQDDWGWSALRTGLAVAPGPLVVPVASAAAGRLVRRVGPGPVIAAGCVLFAAGTAWWSGAVGLRPAYVHGLLGGLIVTGVGVGFALPTLFAAAAGALPPARFATGSAVVSMARQIGFAAGVALLVAVLGSPRSPAARLSAFQHGWLAITGAAVAAALAATLVRRPRPAPTPVPGEPASQDRAASEVT